MRYLLIRNTRLANLPPDQKPTSVLLCDDRIVGIGANLQHPLIDTDTIDADGLYTIPAIVDLCKPQPERFTPDHCKSLNFENITAGVTSIMTLSKDIEENIADFQMANCKLLNYAFHFPLRQVTEANQRHFRRLMITHGIATAMLRFGDDANADVANLQQNIDVARALNLMVLYDFRSLPDPLDRLVHLQTLADLLRENPTNRAFILGVETERELQVICELRKTVDAKAQLCLNPFDPPTPDVPRLSHDQIADTLRSARWSSLGLGFSASRAVKEGWPDTALEIVSRNRLSLINSLASSRPLTPAELAEFVIERPASFVGLRNPMANVSEGMSANLILWNADFHDEATIAPPGSEPVHLKFSGHIDYVIMNGQLVMGERLIPKRICGTPLYARLV